MHQQQLSAPSAFGKEQGTTTKDPEPSLAQGVTLGWQVGACRSGQCLSEVGVSQLGTWSPGSGSKWAIQVTSKTTRVKISEPSRGKVCMIIAESWRDRGCRRILFVCLGGGTYPGKKKEGWWLKAMWTQKPTPNVMSCAIPGCYTAPSHLWVMQMGALVWEFLPLLVWCVDHPL